MLVYVYMKNISIKNIIVYVGVALVVFATLMSIPTTTEARTECNYEVHEQPTVVTKLPSYIDDENATLSAYYTSGDACYSAFAKPHVVFEFGHTSSMAMESEPLYQMLGSRTLTIDMNDLEPDETYYYRAVLYDGTYITKGAKIKFRTHPEVEEDTTGDGITIAESDEVIDISETNITPTRTTPVVRETASTRPRGGILNTTDNAVRSAPTIQVSELDIAIDNNVELLRSGSFVTYEVTYENTSNTKELEDAVMEITLPTQVRFESTTEGSYNTRREAVVVNLRDLRPGANDTIEVTARVRGAGQDTQAVATVEVTYRDIDAGVRKTVIATDIDEVEQTDSLLAAGLFTGNFAPGSVVGWLAVGLLLVAIIYLVRVHVWKYYWAKQRPQKPRHVQENTIGEVPRA